jgi:hypothetical protein
MYLLSMTTVFGVPARLGALDPMLSASITSHMNRATHLAGRAPALAGQAAAR